MAQKVSVNDLDKVQGGTGKPLNVKQNKKEVSLYASDSKVNAFEQEKSVQNKKAVQNKNLGHKASSRSDKAIENNIK